MGQELITFVFVAIYQFQHAFHQGFVDPPMAIISFLGPLTPPFDILVEYLVEDIVIREAVAILLAGAEFGRGCFLQDVCGG